MAKLLASHGEEPKSVSQCSFAGPGLGSTPSLRAPSQLSTVIPYCLWQQAITGAVFAIMPFLNVGKWAESFGQDSISKIDFHF